MQRLLIGLGFVFILVILVGILVITGLYGVKIINDSFNMQSQIFLPYKRNLSGEKINAEILRSNPLEERVANLEYEVKSQKLENNLIKILAEACAGKVIELNNRVNNLERENGRN